MGKRELEGRSAWVTGGASGMGRAIALGLAEAGANVAIGSLTALDGVLVPADADTYLPTEEQLAESLGAIESHGVAGFARALDVRSDADVESFFDAASRALGPMDILVNAAGIDVHHPMAGHPDEPWHRVLDTNLNGSFRTIKRCLPGMQTRGWGRIVILASTAASVGARTNAAYCASKSGLLGLMRCVALEGAPHGVTCNAVSPGYVDTPMAHSSFLHAVERGEVASVAAARSQVAESSPQGELIVPDEVAAVVVFLCTQRARRVNMEDIRVSGGAAW